MKNLGDVVSFLKTELENNTKSYLEEIEVSRKEKIKLEEKINDLPYKNEKTRDTSEYDVRL